MGRVDFINLIKVAYIVTNHERAFLHRAKSSENDYKSVTNPIEISRVYAGHFIYS